MNRLVEFFFFFRLLIQTVCLYQDGYLRIEIASVHYGQDIIHLFMKLCELVTEDVRATADHKQSGHEDGINYFILI